MSRYRHVSAMKADGFPVRAACAVAEVSPSAYYAWLERSMAPTEAEWDEALLVNEMVDIHAESDSTYGSPRMTPELRRHGFCANHKRVERLMREHGIVGVSPRRSVRTTIRDDLAPPLPDLIGQDFSATFGRRFPSAVACLNDDLASLFSYLRFPVEHHKRIRHSNFIERTFGETRRRVKVIGRLPGERSCLGLVWAVPDRASRGWRGVTMTPTTVRQLQDLRRQLLHPPTAGDPHGQLDETVTAAA